MAELTDYIKIESYLKDVPDSFLMGEINKPQSKYPPVLVVAEYNRRKRMRNEAQGQQQGEPKSVVEDIKAETGLMSIPGAAQSLAFRDMKGMGPPPAEMQAMPQQQMQPQMAQGQMPMRMAEGGLVAFEQGGPIRAQTGLFVDPTMTEPMGMEAYGPGTLGKFFFGPEGAGIGNVMFELNKRGYTEEQIQAMSPAEKRFYAQQPVAPQAAYPDETKRGPALSVPTPPTAPAAAPAAATKPPPAAEGGLGTFKQGALPSIKPFTDALTTLQNIKAPTDADIAATRQAGMSEFEQLLPDRASQMLQDRILRKTGEIQKDKDMSFNDALFAAGAAILKSPGTPGSLSWMGEGLEAFGKTMQEGKKDMRKSQDLLDQANIDLANSQSLRDQGKLAAAEKAENKAYSRFAQARALAQSDASLKLQQVSAEIEMAKLPSEIAQKQGLVGYYGALAQAAGQPKPKATTLKDALEARQALMTQAMTAGMDIKDPNVIARIESQIQSAFPGYTPLDTGPVIRGAGGQGATLPGT